MGRHTRASAVAALVVALSDVQGALAQSEPSAVQQSKLEAAKALFLEGNQRVEAGDIAGALGLFQRSRALVPSIANTTNAALMLERLGRLDEALATYDELLSAFASTLTAQERGAIASKLASLQAHLGAVEVSASAPGVLHVDGRQIGPLPLTAPLRLLPGLHVLRVTAEGYAAAEALLSVTAGQSVKVDLKLEALSAVGRLRVSELGGAAGLTVLVDGAAVGATPWEGSLGPGQHTVQLVGEERGSALSATNIVAGQTSETRLVASALGEPVRIEVDPRSAQLVIDGVSAGRGAWEGRLPVGPHEVKASEEGYVLGRASLVAGQRSSLRLSIDETHPRWRAGKRPELRLDALVGAGLGASLHSRAEQSCMAGEECSASGVGGPMFALRLAYMLPVGIRIEATGGYLHLSQDLDRELRSDDGQGIYALHDALTVSGPYAALGVGAGYPVGKGLSLVGRASLGTFFARSRDVIDGKSFGPGGWTDLAVERSGKGVSGVNVFVMPELGLELRRGGLTAGLGLGAGFFLLDGPTLENGELGPAGAASPSQCTLGSPACRKGTNSIAREQAHGRFTLLVPQLSAGWSF